MIDENMTIAEARAWFRKRAIDDQELTMCPCCDRSTKAYSRRFNSSMLNALEWLHERSGGVSYIDVPNTAPQWLVRTNQLPSCRWWGFVVRDDSEAADQNKKHTGYWRTTELARAWLSGETLVPCTAFTYAGVLIELRGDMMGPQDVKDGFKISEVHAKS